VKGEKGGLEKEGDCGANLREYLYIWFNNWGEMRGKGEKLFRIVFSRKEAGGEKEKTNKKKALNLGQGKRDMMGKMEKVGWNNHFRPG